MCPCIPVPPLALLVQLSEMLPHVAAGDGASPLRGPADPWATQGLLHAVQVSAIPPCGLCPQFLCLFELHVP